ncbi:MAG TPA: heme-binding protein [Candidatus Acidoferrales bacterium]
MTTRGAISTGLICAAFLATALAQTPGGRPPDKPASPASLPGDTLPPFGMLDANGKLVPLLQRLSGTAGHGAARQAVSIRGPALSLAVEAVQTAVDTCTAGGYYIGASVIDTSGQPRAMVEAEGSDGGHVYVAVRKALVALAFKMPSSKASETVPSDQALLARVTPNMFVMEGAVPLMAGNEVIGAIGASGAAGGDQDEVCAIAGLNKIKSRLR